VQRLPVPETPARYSPWISVYHTPRKRSAALDQTRLRLTGAGHNEPRRSLASPLSKEPEDLHASPNINFWIQDYEKIAEWTDSAGEPERVLSRHQILDDITLYWVTNTAASSSGFYWENNNNNFSATTSGEVRAGLDRDVAPCCRHTPGAGRARSAARNRVLACALAREIFRKSVARGRARAREREMRATR
jgi:hypothetical protein